MMTAKGAQVTITDRLTACDQNFEETKALREEQLQIINTATTKAKELWDEMMRLQGEYRVLQELQGTESKANKATVIDAVPEEKQ